MTMNSSYIMNCRAEADFQSWHNWIGKRVSVNSSKEGVLKYFGETKFSDGMWCGVELDEPAGKNDGSVMGIRYFTCKDNYGIFVPLSKTKKLSSDVTFPSHSSDTKIPENPKILSMSDFPSLNLNCQENKTFINVNSLLLSNDNGSLLPMDSALRKEAINTVNESYIVSVEDEHLCKDDTLNKTVILGEENLTLCKMPINSNNTFSEESPVFNATFDLDCSKNAAHELIKSDDKKGTADNTFILDEQNNTLEANGNVTFDKPLPVCGNIQIKNIDKRPSFLSLSQMTDFTICLDPSFCDNFEYGELPHKGPSPELFSDNQTVVFASPVDNIKNKCELDDSVFQTEYEDGYKEFLLDINKSAEEFNNNDSLKHSFQLRNVQSSTPSEKSKQNFKEKMSLIRSFQLEDISVITDPCIEAGGSDAVHVISNLKGVTTGKTVLSSVKKDIQLIGIDKPCQMNQPPNVVSENLCISDLSFNGEISDLNGLVLEGNKGISVLLNVSDKSSVGEISGSAGSSNTMIMCKEEECPTLSKYCLNTLEAQQNNTSEKNKSPCSLKQSLTFLDNNIAVDCNVSKERDIGKEQISNILNDTIVKDKNVDVSSGSIPLICKLSLEESGKTALFEKKDVCYSLNETFKGTPVPGEVNVKPSAADKLYERDPVENVKKNALDETFNCDDLVNFPVNKLEFASANAKIEIADSDSCVNNIINNLKESDKIFPEFTSNIESVEKTNVKAEIDRCDTNQTFNLNSSFDIPSREGVVDSISPAEKYEKDFFGHKEKDSKSIYELKADYSTLNVTICVKDEKFITYSAEDMKNENPVLLNKTQQNLDATVCLSEVKDCNIAFDIPDIANSETNSTDPKNLIPKKSQSSFSKNMTEKKDTNENFVLLNKTQQDLDTTICLSEVKDFNMTFDSTDIADSEPNSSDIKNYIPKKIQSSFPKSTAERKDNNKFQRPKSLAFVNPKRPTLPAVNQKVKINNNTGYSSRTSSRDFDCRSKKMPDKWDAATSKTSKENEKLKPKKEPSMKGNTNVKMSRFSLSRQSMGTKTDTYKPIGFDKQLIKNIPETKAMKNAYNYHRVSSYAKKENISEGNLAVKGKPIPNVGNRAFILKENVGKKNIPAKSPDDGSSCSHPPSTPSRRDSIQSTASQSSKQSSKIAVLQNKVPAPTKFEAQSSSTDNKKSKIPSNMPKFKPPLNSQKKMVSTSGVDGLLNQTVRKSPKPPTAEKASVAVVRSCLPRRIGGFSKLKPTQ